MGSSPIRNTTRQTERRDHMKLEKDLRNETPLFEVDYIFRVGQTSVSYAMAHKKMQELAESGVFKKNETIGISFQATTDISRSYLQGLAEYINEYTEIKWYARTPSLHDSSTVLKEMTGDNFHVIEEIPYSKIKVVRV